MFLKTFDIEISTPDQTKKKKNLFSEKNFFSTSEGISGPDPGTDSGTDSGADSGESKQLIFVRTFVIFSYFSNFFKRMAGTRQGRKK